jgi:hypothetical protein
MWNNFASLTYKQPPMPLHSCLSTTVCWISHRHHNQAEWFAYTLVINAAHMYSLIWQWILCGLTLLIVSVPSLSCVLDQMTSQHTIYYHTLMCITICCKWTSHTMLYCQACKCLALQLLFVGTLINYDYLYTTINLYNRSSWHFNATLRQKGY